MSSNTQTTAMEQWGDYRQTPGECLQIHKQLQWSNGGTIGKHQGNVFKYTNNCNGAMGGLEANIMGKSWNTERWNGLTQDSCKAADGPESSTHAGKKKKRESVQMMVKWLMHIHFSNNMTWSALAKEGKTHTQTRHVHTNIWTNKTPHT